MTAGTPAADRRGARGAASLDRPPRQVDGVTVLTVLLVGLFAVPARLVFRPLGGAGNPAMLLGMLLFVWYIGVRLVPWQRPPRDGFAARVLLALFGLSVLASYVAGMTRPISGEEVRAADRGILVVAAALGIAFTAMDGTPDRERLDTLLYRLTTGGAALAALGIFQYYSGFDVTRYIAIPGLSTGGPSIIGIDERSGLRRVAGTATHPIEFGVVLGVLLPVALHVAVHAAPGERLGRWLRVGLIAVALPLSLSRSAMVAVTVALFMLVPTWPPRRRRAVLATVPLFAVAVRVSSPGVVGTIVGLFTNIGGQTSITARTDDYSAAEHYIAGSPFFGRGYGTFLPDQYRILDNAYLGQTIETGIVGLAMMLLLFGGMVRIARVTRRRAADDRTRDLAQSLAAAVAAAAVSFVTFDARSFEMVLVVVFLLLGCVGTLARLMEQAETASPPAQPGIWDLGQLCVRRWYVTAALAGLSVTGLARVHDAGGTFEASARLAVMAEPTGQGNPYAVFHLTHQAIVEIVAQRVGGGDALVNLASSGARAQYVVEAQHLGNQENTTAPPAPSVLVTAWSSDPRAALAEMRLIVADVQTELADVQNSVAPPFATRLEIVPTALPARATHVAGSRSRALASAMLLAGMIILFVHCLAERLFRKRLFREQPLPREHAVAVSERAGSADGRFAG
jgi:polysaccharide biosynthesis protein PslJ